MAIGRVGTKSTTFARTRLWRLSRSPFSAASVTVGRILFAAAQRFIPSRWIYRLLPLLVAVAYLGVSLTAHGSVVQSVLAFITAGLGCSALLPLTISFGEEQFPSPSVSGRLIAVYHLGYGIAAFGVGPLLGSGLSLSEFFAAASGVALVLSAVAFLVTASRWNAAANTP